ncbi:MAG: ABC transporter ATP-binding protein [Burkholderiaceae bacterium]
MSASTAVPTLSASGLGKRFGGVAALTDVSIALRAGEILGLIGPNGSGKTTLLNLLSGYYPPTTGRIDCAGRPLDGRPVQARAETGIARTFQKPRLLDALSVLDNTVIGGWRLARAGFLSSLLAGPRARTEMRDARRRAAAILDGLGLGRSLHRRADSLDHGEQRLVEIARALALRPSFVLLDEPAGGLSDVEIERLETIIRTVRDAGIGVLLVEHHTDLVFRLCDRVIALDLGRTMKSGTPDEVRNDPDVIRTYLGA